jgi:hypothetical protein
MRRLKTELIRDYFSTNFTNPLNSLIINDLSQRAILEYLDFVPNKSHTQPDCISEKISQIDQIDHLQVTAFVQLSSR